MALVSQTYRWPDPTTGPYRLEIRLDEIAGRLLPVSWALSGESDGTSPARPLTVRGARKVPWGELTDRLAEDMRRRWAPIIAASTSAQDIAALLASPGGTDRPVLYDDTHWQAVAGVYREAVSRPVVAVAERFVVSRSTAGNWVRRCRQKGLL